LLVRLALYDADLPDWLAGALREQLPVEQFWPLAKSRSGASQPRKLQADAPQVVPFSLAASTKSTSAARRCSALETSLT
jgi:hypothetical protein